MAFMAGNYQVAKEHDVGCMLSGNNWATEGILPRNWGYKHKDVVNIRDIHDKHGSVPLSTYPMMSFMELQRAKRNIGFETPLNHIRYNRREAKHILKEAWGWRDYGNKHCESICTRLYQQYILPWRTNWDKRRPHFSSLICSGQMMRDEALEELEEDPYDSKPQKDSDYRYFIDKLGLTSIELSAYIDQPIVPNQAYKTNERQYNALRLGKRLVLSPMRALRKAFA
jgi:hypothetical protein